VETKFNNSRNFQLAKQTTFYTTLIPDNLISARANERKTQIPPRQRHELPD
jgi:hypothetical protein